MEPKETIHSMKEPNKNENHLSFTGKIRYSPFPVDKIEYLYTKEDLKEAYKYGRMWTITSFEEWFEQFKKK